MTTVVDGCALIGLTATGSTNNPFQNNLNIKAIDLATGSYYTFNEPFFCQGESLEVIANFSNGVSMNITSVLPSLASAGNTVFKTTIKGETLFFKLRDSRRTG